MTGPGSWSHRVAAGHDARMTDTPAKPAGGRQVDPAEERYAEELAFLAA